MTTTVAILTGRNLSRRRSVGGTAILDNVDFELFVGDRVGLVGASGSGKSSLLRALVKLDAVDSGEIRYHGNLLSREQIPGFRRRVIYLPQRPSFMIGTVRENLLAPLSFASAGSIPQVDYVDWLSEAGKTPLILEQAVESLSGGEQQLVSLLRAIQLEPEVLLFDEPTASLDEATSRILEQIIDRWYAETPGRAYAWTSHNAEQIARRSDRCVTMESGRLTQT